MVRKQGRSSAEWESMEVKGRGAERAPGTDPGMARIRQRDMSTPSEQNLKHFIEKTEPGH
jgi:hypothetical protein